MLERLRETDSVDVQFQKSQVSKWPVNEIFLLSCCCCF